MNSLRTLIKTQDVFHYNFKFQLINKEQKGSTIGGLLSIIAYVLYLMFCFLIAENFWTHNEDRYSTNYFKYHYEDEGDVNYKDLNMGIGVVLNTLAPNKYMSILRNENERN